MPTRRQKDSAFASSSELERGVLGNLVAARCSALTDPEEIALIWWLQQISWREGGLEEFHRNFDAQLSLDYFVSCEGDRYLRKLLVDPADYNRMGEKLRRELLKLRAEEAAAAAGHIVATAITQQVSEELDFAFESRSFVLIEGREGIGKSEGARSWCAQHPGQAIYVALESGADETTLYRSIARAIGTACSYQRMAGEMRMRIQDAFQGGNLMLVIDEAHFLWPQAARSERIVPKRMDWVRTALVDCGVPVALVSTPQFFSRQCERFRKAGWNSNQVERRLTRIACLPDTISERDALSVGRSYFPDVPARLLTRVAAVARMDVARLTMFSHLRKRVDFLASRRPGISRVELLEAALAEIGAPGGYGKEQATPLQTQSMVLASRVRPEVFAAPNRISSSSPVVEMPVA